MEHDLEQTVSLLTRTPAALDALLRDLPESWTYRNEGENTWSPFDTVAHLIHNEIANWMSRARVMLQFGETRPLGSLDRWELAEESRGRPLGELLDQFARLRSDNLAELRGFHLAKPDLERRGRHPVFGSVTLSQLLATWAAHDLTHLHQISRVMAHQYREAVGPWTRYLGVMRCAGHSDP